MPADIDPRRPQVFSEPPVLSSPRLVIADPAWASPAAMALVAAACAAGLVWIVHGFTTRQPWFHPAFFLLAGVLLFIGRSAGRYAAEAFLQRTPAVGAARTGGKRQNSQGREATGAISLDAQALGVTAGVQGTAASAPAFTTAKQIRFAADTRGIYWPLPQAGYAFVPWRNIGELRAERPPAQTRAPGRRRRTPVVVIELRVDGHPGIEPHDRLVVDPRGIASARLLRRLEELRLLSGQAG